MNELLQQVSNAKYVRLPLKTQTWQLGAHRYHKDRLLLLKQVLGTAPAASGSWLKMQHLRPSLNQNPHFIRFPCTFRFNPLLKIS